MKNILGIDLGTTSMKALLFDEELSLLNTAKAHYRTDYPAPGWAEQDVEPWWLALKTVIKILYDFPDAPPMSKLDIIAVDAMTPTIVPVDVSGRPLRKSLIWMDRRAENENRLIKESLGDEIFSIGGNVSDPSNLAPKIRWIKENEPENYRRTNQFLSANAYLVRRLTGINSMDVSQCGLSQLCDNPTGIWSDKLIDASGLDREKFPEIVECTSIVGTLTRKVALELGLSASTKVIAGAMDNAAAVMGTGSMEDGDLCISAGTAANVNLCLAKAHFDPCFLVYRHISPSVWIHAGAVDGGGASYKWFADLIGQSDYAALDRRVAQVKPGVRPLIFLPYMLGQRAPLWDNHSRGVLFGLDPSMKDGDLARALMEGNALGVRNILALMGRLGAVSSACRLTGGCAESHVYSQIFADVLGLDIIRIGQTDTAALGIAMTAAKAAGFFPDFESMLPAISTSGYLSSLPENVDYYAKISVFFERLYSILKPEFKALTTLIRKEK